MEGNFSYMRVSRLGLSVGWVILAMVVETNCSNFLVSFGEGI